MAQQQGCTHQHTGCTHQHTNLSIHFYCRIANEIQLLTLASSEQAIILLEPLSKFHEST
jgi:hypothetical protein